MQEAGGRRLVIYDVIVVGARCAGSPTAMLLARRGHRVLLLDRATFPSDTMSTHLLKVLAVAALERWGLLEEVLRRANCPPISKATFDVGDFSLTGSPPPFGPVEIERLLAAAPRYGQYLLPSDSNEGGEGS